MESLDQKKELLRKLLLAKSMKQRKFGLSQGQKAMWFLQNMDKDSVNYNTGFAIKITGKIDADYFGVCLTELGKRHASLRATFKENEDGEFQEIVDQTISLEVVDAKGKNEEEVFQLVDQKLKKVFDLAEGNLVQPTLFETGTDAYVFLFALHHIIYDEWTSRILLQELIGLYQRKSTSTSFELPTIKKGYSDFVKYQEEVMENPELISFWENNLKDYEASTLELNGDKEFMVTPSKKVEGAIINSVISPAIIEGVRQLGKQNKVTLFNFMVSVCQLALHKFSDQNQFFIGTPVAGRNNADFHQTVGYFVNLIPLKCSINPEDSFTSFLKSNAVQNNQALAHQDFPFNKMVESFYGERSLAKHPFFNVAFTYYNQRRLQEEFAEVLSSIDEYSFEEYDLNSQESAFDITIEVKELLDSGSLKVKYNASKYSDGMMNEFSAYVLQLLERIVSNEEASISDLTKLGKMNSVSNSQGDLRDLNSAPSVYEEFTNQVELHTESIALKQGDKTKSYGQLNLDIETIRSQIGKHITTGECNIGLLTNSSIEMIQGIFSILGVGACYVPIKTNLPDGRLSFIIENSGIQLLLCDRANFDTCSTIEDGVTVLCIEDLLEDTSKLQAFTTPDLSTNSIAYLMYTSGSTGNPKGIQIAQGNILNLVKDQSYISIKNGDQIPQLSNYSFDGSVFDIFGTLLNGATLHLIAQDTIESADELVKYFNTNTINVGFFTTALFNTLVSHDASNYLSSFDTILFGGEQVSTKHVQTALKFVKNENVLVHVYGPTETTTFASYYPIRSVQEMAKTLPIGKALAGVNMSIRTKNGTIAPIGVVGEIYIKGSGVAKNGYYKLEEVSDKFIKDPIAQNEALYATGDFGFMTAEGDIVFAGRKDHQIKLRGFRIELGEIEAALYQIDHIGKTVALIHESNTDKSMLIAVVESESDKLTEEQIKKELVALLPDFMIPGKIIFLKDIELNKNAKIDRTILLQRIHEVLSTGVQDRQAPTTKNEIALVAIWSEILDSEEIGVNESFFVLGGNSLLAMRVLSRIKYTIGVDLKPADIFETPTISALALKIDDMNVKPPETIKIKRSNRDKYLIQ